MLATLHSYTTDSGTIYRVEGFGDQLFVTRFPVPSRDYLPGLDINGQRHAVDEITERHTPYGTRLVIQYATEPHVLTSPVVLDFDQQYDTAWPCGLCGEDVREGSLHKHACCGCGWRDSAQDGRADWRCANCDPLPEQDLAGHRAC